MNASKKSMLLYAVTDRAWLNNTSLASEVEKAIKGGATFIQLREKDAAFSDFIAIAREVKAVTDRYKVPFVINDNIDVALEVDADGVHVGQRDDNIVDIRRKLGYNKIIGVSVHNELEGIYAQEKGADYIGVGAVFPTSTKTDATILSFSDLKNICKSVSIPVVAIGGITKENILKLSGSGIDGVAVVSAIFAQKNIERETRELLSLAKQMVGLI